jgi:hypothetical protein
MLLIRSGHLEIRLGRCSAPYVEGSAQLLIRVQVVRRPTVPAKGNGIGSMAPKTSGTADERASARRRLAAPFALDGAYGAPWQRMSYRTTNVRNPV